MYVRQQSTSAYPIPILLVSSTDGVTPLGSGVTPVVNLRKNAGSAATAAGTITATDASGVAYLQGNAVDRNTLGSLVLEVTATGADPVTLNYAVVPWDPFDAARLGLTSLPAAPSGQINGAPVLVENDGGVVGVRVVMIADTPVTSSAVVAIDFGDTVATRANQTTAQASLNTLTTRVPSTVHTASQQTTDHAAELTAIGNVPGLVWASGTRTLTSFGTLVADVAAAVWGSLTAGLVTSGTIGKWILDKLDVAVSSVSAGGVGDGDTEVDENTGGAGNLRYVNSSGTGIANASVVAYLKSDYDAGTYTRRGRTVTDDNGDWVAPLMLNSGLTYTIRFEVPGEYGPDTKEVAIP